MLKQTGIKTASDIFSFSTVAQLDKPNRPSLSAQTSTGFTVTWQVVSGATQYNVQVDDNANFSSLVKNLPQQTGTSVAVTGLVPNTTYYVRVRAKNDVAESNSPYSDATSIKNQCLSQSIKCPVESYNKRSK